MRKMLITLNSDNNFHKETFINKKSCFNKVICYTAFRRIKIYIVDLNENLWKKD